MSSNSELPEIVINALEQNNISAPNSTSDITYPIRLADLATLIAQSQTSKITVSDIEIDLAKKTASKNSILIDLTEKEIELISFINSSEAAVSKEDILENVWGYSADTNTRTVETHLHRLNGKFQDSFDEKLITQNNSKYSI